MQELATFEKFNSKIAAEAFGEFLESKGIDYQIQDDSPELDSSFTGNFAKEFRVKLKQEDFDKVHKLVEQAAAEELEQLPENYYLLSFSETELLEVISAKDEWSAFDFMLAQKLLKDKGREVSDEEMQTLKKQRIEKLSQPDKPDAVVNFFGWIAVFLGGFLGLLVGWYLSTHKKTLPNGQMIFAFADKDRKTGRAMIRWSFVSMAIWIGLYVFRLSILAN